MRLMLAAAVAAAAGTAAAQAPAAHTVALRGADGTPAGTVTLTAAPRGVLMRVAATGLTPGWHGIHVHAVGDCSDRALGFKKSGGHMHGESGSVHGLLNPAATDTGDLPNIHADAAGRADADLYTATLTMAALTDADGAAIVIHARPDDYVTQPIGGAGDRVACGVVK